MTFLAGATILVSIIAESSCGLTTKPPPCLLSQVGSNVWFNFSSDRDAELYKISDGCKRVKPSMLATGQCANDMDCTYSDVDRKIYRLPLSNITPADAGIYVAKGDNGSPQSDTSSTILTLYEYATTCHHSLDGEFTLNVSYWGRLQNNVTMNCPGASRHETKHNFNETEVRVFGLHGGVISCKVQVSSWCQSISSTCDTSLMFNVSTSANSESDCLSRLASLSTTPHIASPTEAIITLSGYAEEDSSTATTAPVESGNKGLIIAIAVILPTILVLSVLVVLVVILIKKRQSIDECVIRLRNRHVDPTTSSLGGQESANTTNTTKLCAVDDPLLAKPSPTPEEPGASNIINNSEGRPCLTVSTHEVS